MPALSLLHAQFVQLVMHACLHDGSSRSIRSIGSSGVRGALVVTADYAIQNKVDNAAEGAMTGHGRKRPLAEVEFVLDGDSELAAARRPVLDGLFALGVHVGIDSSVLVYDHVPAPRRCSAEAKQARTIRLASRITMPATAADGGHVEGTETLNHHREHATTLPVQKLTDHTVMARWPQQMFLVQVQCYKNPPSIGRTGVLLSENEHPEMLLLHALTGYRQVLMSA